MQISLHKNLAAYGISHLHEQPDNGREKDKGKQHSSYKTLDGYWMSPKQADVDQRVSKVITSS